MTCVFDYNKRYALAKEHNSDNNNCHAKIKLLLLKKITKQDGW